MADDEENDPTAPFNELEAFDTIYEALTWNQIKKRTPICIKKTLHNRYFLANLVYLIYAIGILLIDFSPAINGSGSSEDTLEERCACNFKLTDDVYSNVTSESSISLVNGFYIGLGVLHVISASLYWWAWKDHRWNDVIMIPEYLNLIEASLYLWSAVWYKDADNDYPDGFYTSTVHIIETVAAFVELFASFGWIMSWYRTYTRTICRGFTFDDPDTIAYTATTLSSFIYITYNIRILQHPEEYGENTLYFNGDIVYSVGAFFYLWANLRDDGWLWWLPVAGQYGISAGRTQTGKTVRVGLPHLLIGGHEPITTCYRQCCAGRFDQVGNDVAPIDDTPPK